MTQESEQILPGQHPEGSHPEAEHVHSDAPSPREPRRDEFSFHVTMAGGTYSIGAQLEDGEVREVAIYDPQGGMVILPDGVLEQLISVVRTQEQLLRQNFFRSHSLGQFRHPNVAGMAQMQQLY